MQSCEDVRIFFWILLLVVLSFFALKTLRGFLVTDQLTELKTDHFLITYYGVYQSDGEDLANMLENNFYQIRNDLNDPDHGMIKVFVHPTRTDFSRATGLSSSSVTGTSRGPLEFHILWTNWYNSVFPDNPAATAVHEFTHCVQLNILIKDAKEKFALEDGVNFDDVFEKKFREEYPQWFWEAIAVYEAKELNILSVKYGMRGEPTLKALNTSNQIYNVGYTVIEYIVTTWGKDKLPALITSYVNFEEILKVNETEFEDGWHRFVQENY